LDIGKREGKSPCGCRAEGVEGGSVPMFFGGRAFVEDIGEDDGLRWSASAERACLDGTAGLTCSGSMSGSRSHTDQWMRPAGCVPLL
jgi:hypothetical protein